jgi:hypothetical protein
MGRTAWQAGGLLALGIALAWWLSTESGVHARMLSDREMVAVVGGTIGICQTGPINRGANWTCEGAPGTFACDTLCDSDCKAQKKAADCAMAVCWNCAAPKMQMVQQCVAVDNAKKSCWDMTNGNLSPCGNTLQATCFWDTTAVPPACICRVKDLKDTTRGCVRTNCR